MTWKHDALTKLALVISPLETGRLTLNLSKKEKAFLRASWSVEQRSRGFHNFCSSPEVVTAVPQLLQERKERLKAEAIEMKEEYVPEDEFSAKHKVKAELWRKIPKERKIYWRSLAEEKGDDIIMDQ
jgi:hypothetical protein